MGTKELWPPSCGLVRTSEVTAMIQMRTLRTQQQSAQSDYSINEPNEGNYNTSAMDANLQISEQLGTCVGHGEKKHECCHNFSEFTEDNDCLIISNKKGYLKLRLFNVNVPI